MLVVDVESSMHLLLLVLTSAHHYNNINGASRQLIILIRIIHLPQIAECKLCLMHDFLLFRHLPLPILPEGHTQ